MLTMRKLLGVLFIGSSVLFSACSKKMSPDTTLPPEIEESTPKCSEKIVFFSSRTNNGDLYAFDPISLETNEFLIADSAIGAPVFNKFRSSLVFAQQSSKGRDLYSKNINTGDITFLIPNPAEDEVPDWSPTENKIVYSLRNHLQSYSLIVRFLDNGEELVLFENALQAFDPVLSPNGSQIAFVLTDSTTNADIAVINVDGTGFKNLTNNSKLHGHPEWSPDGSTLLFYISKNGNADLYTFELETNTLTQLTFDSANQLVGRFSSDGKKIAYGGFFEGDWEIFMMDSDGNNKEQVTFNPGFDGDPVWIPCN